MVSFCEEFDSEPRDVVSNLTIESVPLLIVGFVVLPSEVQEELRGHVIAGSDGVFW